MLRRSGQLFQEVITRILQRRHGRKQQRRPPACAPNRTGAGTGCARINGQKFHLTVIVRLCSNKSSKQYVLSRNQFSFFYLLGFHEVFCSDIIKLSRNWCLGGVKQNFLGNPQEHQSNLQFRANFARSFSRKPPLKWWTLKNVTNQKNPLRKIGCEIAWRET